MSRFALLPLLFLFSLHGCDAQSQPLPHSERLSAEKVEAIAQRINDRYPDLTGQHGVYRGR